MFETIHGFLLPFAGWALAGLALGLLTLGFLAAPFWGWAALLGVALVGFGAPVWLLGVFAVVAAVGLVTPLRRALVSGPIMATMKALKFLPVISKTETEALEAGTVWAEGELFSGKPDFDKLLAIEHTELSAEEQAFLDGPVERLCEITDDWEVFQKRDLSHESWEAIKQDGFFGLIVPKEYGGKGFSSSAVSAIIAKLASRSGPLAITVMVPNSLGPAELLHHYGTKEQKEYYLPRLARGEEIPCFALTEPNAGSDAGAISSQGEVFKGEDGELYLRLTWEKRYITLAAISTILGLAFKLSDPENLLGKGRDLGITCALIPTDTEGVVLGKRHDPLGVPFYNCPTSGKDVVVPISAIIGGTEGAGRGWLMLMECLAAGRGVMLPASSTAGAKMAARMTGAYAAVRKQFGLPIGKFEGIEEPLARIGGTAYILEAARRYTNAGLDTGAKPAVVSAMAKYQFTEACRDCINDAMDVLGGAAISKGPRNMLAHAYAGVPISITVEGANILTRTLMIFGQGAIRCHPYAYKEVKAVEAGNVKAFDEAFWGHTLHVIRNGSRALLLSLTRGALAGSPVSGPTATYYKKLSWASASFGFLADVAMAGLGGDLKRKETITGRFSDIFSWMYLGTTVLKRWEADGRPKEDLVFVHWAMQKALAEIQKGFDGIYANLGIPVLGAIFKYPIGLWSRLNSLGDGPGDDLSHKVAQALQVPGAQRDRISDGMYLPTDVDSAVGRLENAFGLSVEAEGVAKKIKAAVKAKKLPRKAPAALVEEALKQGVITGAEADLVRRAEEARFDAITVDSFDLDEYLETSQRPYTPPDAGGDAQMPLAS